MRAVKDIITSMENKLKTKSRKGYQALSRTIAQLRGRIGTKTGSLARNIPRSKSRGQR